METFAEYLAKIKKGEVKPENDGGFEVDKSELEKRFTPEEVKEMLDNGVLKKDLK